MASSPLVFVVVPLGQPAEQPGQHQIGVAAQPEAAVACDLPADPAQRAERAVEVVGAGQRPRLDDVEQVGLVGLGLPVDLAGRDGAGDGLYRPAPGTRSTSPRRRSVWASSVCCWAESSRIRTGRPARAGRRRRAARAWRARPRAPRGRGRRGPGTASGAPAAARGRARGRGASVSRLASTASSIAASKWSASTSTWARKAMSSAVSADGGHFSRASRAGGDVGGGGVRVVLDQRPGGRRARAARRSTRARCSRRRRRRRRRAGRGRRSRPRGRWPRAAASSRPRGRRGDRVPAGGSRISSSSRVDRPARAGICRSRGSFPRVGPCAPPARTTLVGCPGRPQHASDAVRLSRARGYLRRSGAHQRSCLLGGSPVPPAECRRGPGRRPFG